MMEELLDHEGVEVDPIDRIEGDTPLHAAVRYVNKLDRADWPSGMPIVEILIEAGADAKSVKDNTHSARKLWLTLLRFKNKAKLKPVELVDPRNRELRIKLQRAEFAQMAGNDVIDDFSDDDRPTGSASDSE